MRYLAALYALQHMVCLHLAQADMCTAHCGNGPGVRPSIAMKHGQRPQVHRIGCHVEGHGIAHGCQVSASVVIDDRSEEHTSELQSLMRISYAVFCLQKKNKYTT